MVFYFTSSDGHLMYMGKDKYENEDLIKWGWQEDIWFHVDDLSSAHVYSIIRNILYFFPENHQVHAFKHNKNRFSNSKKKQSKNSLIFNKNCTNLST